MVRREASAPPPFDLLLATPEPAGRALLPDLPASKTGSAGAIEVFHVSACVETSQMCEQRACVWVGKGVFGEVEVWSVDSTLCRRRTLHRALLLGEWLAVPCTAVHCRAVRTRESHKNVGEFGIFHLDLSGSIIWFFGEPRIWAIGN